ncbi:GW dipeptide domain-containing protein [Leuconostoc pseudomesenteroides]|uniref:GW dipeptide domain-containing protein n=1 Tax=Leuconostoc pseudomesenteroides TaxID=33968 RepID=UPI00403D8326
MKKMSLMVGGLSVVATVSILSLNPDNSVFASVPAIYAGTSGLPRMDVVDVSSNNGNISVTSFEKMHKYGVSAAIVKLTEATSYRNPYAAQQIANAKRAGLKVGAYHYSWYTSPSSAQAEAKYFTNYAKSLNLSSDTLMVDDLEDTYTKKNNVTNNAKAFNTQLKLSGYTNTSTYTGLSYKNETGLNFSYIGNTRVWMAQYPFTPSGSSLWNTTYGMWQWNSNTTFPGVSGTFDVSIDYTNLISQQYDTITSQKAVNYKAQIEQSGRRDGLFINGPRNTSIENVSTKVMAPSYDKQSVSVTAIAVTRTGTWAQVVLNDGKTYWIDNAGLRTFDTITSQKAVNYKAQIEQSGRRDGLFINGPRNTSIENVSTKVMAPSYDKQSVSVTAIAVTRTGTWAQVVLNDGKTYWIDNAGLRTFDTITSQKAVNYKAQIEQSGRRDGLFINGPRNTSIENVSTKVMAPSYDKQSVSVTAIAVTRTGTWAQVVLNDGKTYWIDNAGLRK